MSSFRTKSSLAVAAALACLGSAQAAVITFEDPLENTLFQSTDSLTQNGYAVTALRLDPTTGQFTGPDGLVGAIVDGSDSGTCASVTCPNNNATHYYAAVNDGLIALTSVDGKAFGVNSFDASFLGASGETLPAGVSGLLRVEGDRADGTFTLAQFSLSGPVNGSLKFGSLALGNETYPTGVGSTGTLASKDFVTMFFFGFVCNEAGNCNAFTTNRGQFALDNISVTAVPEPSQWLLMGLGLGAMGAVARRRRSAA